MKTREEEIKLLVQHLAKVWHAGANFNLEALFGQAVQWADEHPAQSIANLQAEIITLKAELESACEQLKMNAENIQKLRNPWISVNDRLPEIGQPCFLANFNKRRCGYGRFYTDDGALTRWERKEGNSTMMYFLHEVTHWMPIPQIETNCK